jgi:hypothetical protein
MIKNLLLLVAVIALSACAPYPYPNSYDPQAPIEIVQKEKEYKKSEVDEYGVVCYRRAGDMVSCVKVMETEATMSGQLKLMKEMLK